MRNLYAPQIAKNAITRHYSRRNGRLTKTDANVRRLRAICRIFGLGPTAVARAGGVSQPYVSRVLSDGDPFTGNQEFYRRLEGRLGCLIESRTAQYFRVSPTPVRHVENAVEQVILGE
jgi:hypothetical protein